MKHLGPLILLSFFLSACNAQIKTYDSTNHGAAIKEQAQIMGQLLLKKDFKSFAEFTYPKVVTMMGGKQNMIETMQKGSQEMELKGTGFLSVTFGDPSKIIEEGNELQCTLQQTIEMKVPNGRLVTTSTVIAISTDNGKRWYFVDTSGKDIQSMKNALPNLSGQLMIPEKQQPVFYKD